MPDTQQAEQTEFFDELGHANEIVESSDSGKSHLSVQMLETPEEGQSQETEQAEETQQVQQPNLNYLINEDGSIKLEATDDEMKQLGVDNPKSYRAFQSQFHRERAQRERERQELLGEIENLKSQLTPKQQEEVFAPPQKPNSDDPIEKMEYLAKMVEYQNKIIGDVSKNFQVEQQKRQQIEQEAQQKASVISVFTEARGVSPEAANNAISILADMQSKAAQSKQGALEYAGFVYDAVMAKLNKPSLTNQQKVNAINQRVVQQGQVLPLGVVPSQTDNKPKKDNFWGDMAQWTKANY